MTEHEIYRSGSLVTVRNHAMKLLVPSICHRAKLYHFNMRRKRERYTGKNFSYIAIPNILRAFPPKIAVASSVFSPTLSAIAA